MAVAGCAAQSTGIERAEPGSASSAATASSPAPPSSAPASSLKSAPKPAPTPTQAPEPTIGVGELAAVLIRKDDPGFGVEWSLRGPVSTPEKTDSPSPTCEAFDRTQYAPTGAGAAASEEWAAESGTQTKHLIQVAIAWPSEKAAKNHVASYRNYLLDCRQYRSGGLDGKSFSYTLKKFRLNLPKADDVGYGVATTIPSMSDVPPTYQTSAVVRRGAVTVLLQYNTSDPDQPPAVGRTWVRSYAKTVDARLAKLTSA
jgi:hypothetical protein